jgi:hypothetical protein
MRLAEAGMTNEVLDSAFSSLILVIWFIGYHCYCYHLFGYLTHTSNLVYYDHCYCYQQKQILKILTLLLLYLLV